MPTPGPNVYPLDTTGLSPANLISNEDHTLTSANSSTYHFVVPEFAPFYREGFIISHRPVGSSGFTVLTPGVDYNFAFPYVGATLQTGKPIYGAISFINLLLEGTVRLTYQTVGGEYTLDETNLIEITANIVYNPRITTWEQVSGAPAHFPPVTHAWTPQDLVGQQDLLTKLDQIRDAILNPASGGLLSHIGDYGNPHRVNKHQVGLGSVMNFPIATIAECVAGLATDRYVTPGGLRAAMSLIDTRQYLTLNEAITLTEVPKIVTFDVLLQMLRTFGILQRTDAVITAPNKPTIIYPVDTGIYIGDQPLRCLNFTGVGAGAVIKTQSLINVGSLVIPGGVNTVKITGRGAVGTTTVTGGSMNAGTPIITPVGFETGAVISELVPNITGDQGSVSCRVVSASHNIDQIVNLNLSSSSSTQRVYSTSIAIGQDAVTSNIIYGTITVIYTGTAPTINNIAGANATVTVLGTPHVFEGSPNNSTLPIAKSSEVVLNVSTPTTITYNCPAGTDITASWYEPAAGTSKIQTDTVWEISSTSTFDSGTIVDGTSFGKGGDFTLSSWKPTRNALVVNTVYFARAKWKFNDGSESSWSDGVAFGYQATNVFPPDGTILGYFCRGVNKYASVADGMGNAVERIHQTNSIECGYDSSSGSTPINITLNANAEYSILRNEMALIHGGGTHPYQITVPIDAYIKNFVENIEDDRVRLYLKDSFYSEYLSFKAANSSTFTNFRLPFKVSKVGVNENIKVELVANMSPTRLGKQGLEPNRYFIKISLNNTGFNSVFNATTNNTKILFKLDTEQMFKDLTGANFIAQGLVTPSNKSLTASIEFGTLIQYSLG